MTTTPTRSSPDTRKVQAMTTIQQAPAYPAVTDDTSAATERPSSAAPASPAATNVAIPLMGPADPGTAVPLMGPAAPAAAVALMGSAAPGTAVALMGPAGPGTAVPLMGAADPGTAAQLMGPVPGIASGR